MEQNNKFSGLEGYKLKPCQKIYLFFKGVADFIIALIATIVLIPLFIIIAIAIKIDSKGPVFFCQDRIGKNGKLFKCIKFRSMAKDVDHNLATYEVEKPKDYITRVGGFIRKTSIDELPQLFNILALQMSLIGFRPTIPKETEVDDFRKQFNVYQVKPGISGWAQVNGRDVLAAEPKMKAMYDNYYVQKVSLWFDIKIFFMTIVAVFKSDGVAEGTIEEQKEEAKEE